jgi:uncharacterized protein (DUF433 family)
MDAVYTLSEVSTYTGVPSTTLRAWFKPRSDGRGRGPVFQSDWEQAGDDFAVSFLNLIEARVASFFRKQGVRPIHIRKTHSALQQRLGISHPFAHQDLRSDGDRIFQIIQADATDAISRQMLFKHVLPHLSGIRYASLTHLAETWQIKKGIVITPHLGFGKPVIENAGVSTLIVAKQYQANGMDANLVARLFKITEESVKNAFRFERSLRRIAA